MTIELTEDEQRMLVPLLENALAEVDAAADPDSTIVPDDPMALMASYDRAHSLLFRLRIATGVEPADPHVVAQVKCRLCNYSCVSVAPVGTDMGALECARCHHMTMEQA